MSPVAQHGRVLGRVAWIVLLLSCAVLSILWWRADLSACGCEFCPDGHCGYAERIHLALIGSRPRAWMRLHQYARWYLHAQIPLAASLVALVMLAIPFAVWSFVATSAAATLLTWIVVRRTVTTAWPLDRTTVALLGVAFWTSVVVVRGLARPVTDAVGMACCACSLWAILVHAERRSVATGARLFLLQLAGLLARVSFIPMLAMPALAELVGAGSRSERIRRATRMGLLFGVLPGVLVRSVTHGLGIDHTASIWSWAHAPQFVSNDRLGDLLAGLWAAGSVYVVIGLLAAVRAEARDTAWRVHLAWSVLYVSFLVLGGGALWPRYFAPIVPSLVVLAAPGVAALVRRHRVIACLVVAAAALASARVIVASIGDPVAVLAGLWSELESGGLQRRERPSMVPVGRGKLQLSASHNSDAVAALADGDRATSWRTSGAQRSGTHVQIDLGIPRPVVSLRLLGDWGEGPRSFVVEGSVDGVLWEQLAAHGEVREAASLETLVVTLPGTRARYLRVRLVASADAPWSIREVHVYVPAPARAARADDRSVD